jgi:hypothetical protein
LANKEKQILLLLSPPAEMSRFPATLLHSQYVLCKSPKKSEKVNGKFHYLPRREIGFSSESNRYTFFPKETRDDILLQLIYLREFNLGMAAGSGK